MLEKAEVSYYAAASGNCGSIDLSPGKTKIHYNRTDLE
jgi:hypothetical protein